MEIIQDMQLETSVVNNTPKVIYANQYEYNSRCLRIQLINNRKPILIDPSSVATLEAIRPAGGVNDFIGTIEPDGKILVPLDYWVCELFGTVRCKISVVSAQGTKITSANFLIKVERSDTGNLACPRITHNNAVTQVIAAENQRILNENMRIQKDQERDKKIQNIEEKLDSISGATEDIVKDIVDEYLQENPPAGGTTFTPDESLSLDDNNVLSVNTLDTLDENSNLPVSSKAVLSVISDSPSSASVFEVTLQPNETDLDAINRVVGTHPVTTGDITIVKKLIVDDKYAYTGYVYKDTEWAAMEGNYSASNVFFQKDLKLTKSFGKYIPDDSGSVTIPAATNKLSLEGLFLDALAETKAPTIDPPSASISNTHSTSVEVGTEVTPGYKITFDDGNYEYGYKGDTSGATGVTATSFVVKDSAGKTNSVQNGTMPKVTVLDSTSYQIWATVNHTAGKTPVNNMGDEVDGAIVSGSVETNKTTALKGYRSFFYGPIKVAPSETALTSTIIRGLTNGGNYNAKKTIEIKANGVTDYKAFIIAIPNDNMRGDISKVESMDGMIVDITKTYIKAKTTVQVADARGTISGVNTNPVAYRIYVWEPASVDPATVHKINLA